MAAETLRNEMEVAATKIKAEQMRDLEHKIRLESSLGEGEKSGM